MNFKIFRFVSVYYHVINQSKSNPSAISTLVVKNKSVKITFLFLGRRNVAVILVFFHILITFVGNFAVDFLSGTDHRFAFGHFDFVARIGSRFDGICGGRRGC